MLRFIKELVYSNICNNVIPQTMLFTYASNIVHLDNADCTYPTIDVTAASPHVAGDIFITSFLVFRYGVLGRYMLGISVLVQLQNTARVWNLTWCTIVVAGTGKLVD